MKKVSISLFLVVFGVGMVSAQLQKVAMGQIGYNVGNYADAIKNLEEALAKPELLKKGKDVAKAQYYLFKSYLAIAVDPNQAQILEMYPNALFKAADNLDKAMNHPETDQYKKKALAGYGLGGNDPMRLWGALYNAGVSVFNAQGNDELALKYFSLADKFNEDHFLTKSMIGSSQLAIKDTIAAIKTFQDAVEVFKKSYNSSIEGIEALKAGREYKIGVDQLSYITQMLGILHQSQGQYKEALAAINTGLELLPGDEDIARVKLHIYQQNRELFVEAKKKFETAIADNPEDVNLKMAYAELLSKNGEDDEAKGLYDRVYKQDPNNFMANYGKGAYYINKAAKISNAIMKLGTSSDDEWKIYQMNDEIVELLKKAYTYMKWLHENDPKNAEWLRQLVSITPILGKDDETADYAKKLGELNQ